MPTVRFPRVHPGAVYWVDDAAIAQASLSYDTVEATQEPHETTAQMIRRVTREREQAALRTQQAEQSARPWRQMRVNAEAPPQAAFHPYEWYFDAQAVRDVSTATIPTATFANNAASNEMYPAAPPQRRAQIQCDYEPDVLPLPG